VNRPQRQSTIIPGSTPKKTPTLVYRAYMQRKRRSVKTPLTAAKVHNSVFRGMVCRGRLALPAAARHHRTAAPAAAVRPARATTGPQSQRCALRLALCCVAISAELSAPPPAQRRASGGAARARRAARRRRAAAAARRRRRGGGGAAATARARARGGGASGGALWCARARALGGAARGGGGTAAAFVTVILV
jgi:hypothetical protein